MVWNDEHVKRKALQIVCNRTFIATRAYLHPSSKKLYLDMRYNFNKAVFAEVKRLCTVLNFDEIKSKQITRARNRIYNTPVTWRNSPLWIDYQRNKHELKFVTDTRLIFYSGRNHWAKTPADLQVLRVICKHFKNL